MKFYFQLDFVIERSPKLSDFGAQKWLDFRMGLLIMDHSGVSRVFIQSLKVIPIVTTDVTNYC